MKKVKTSISLSNETRSKLHAVAKQMDRSRSYIVEKFIEETFGESSEAGRKVVQAIRESRPILIPIKTAAEYPAAHRRDPSTPGKNVQDDQQKNPRYRKRDNPERD